MVRYSYDRQYIVRMAEWSKALRSGRSPLLWAWVRIPLLTNIFPHKSDSFLDNWALSSKLWGFTLPRLGTTRVSEEFVLTVQCEQFFFCKARPVNVVILENVRQFSWCSGYHICLTHRRSPVRSRAKTCFPRGLTARISGFHPGGPGSTPGVGIYFWDLFQFYLNGMKKFPLPGIEPGPPGWEPGILTTRP